MRKAILLIILSAELIAARATAGEIPVMLMIKRAEQADSTGCNFVEQITSLLYREITAGKVRLWDSPEKEIPISGSTLQEIEKGAGVKFEDQETIFIYEVWDSNKREIITKTVGISFFHKKETGEEVSFGFVDYADINELFMRTRINTNASGVYSATYTTYMLSKNFNYNFVQFAGKHVSSVTDSENLKKSYVKNLPFNATLLGYYPPDKFVSYLIDIYSDGKDDKSVMSKEMIKSIEDFFINNQEVFFNMGGDRITSHIQKNKTKITRIEATEIWRKLGDKLQYELKTVTIFYNDSALNELNPRNLSEIKVDIDGKDLAAILNEKSFSLIITQINSQVIKRRDSYLYYKGLTTSPWNQVIQYVVNY